MIDAFQPSFLLSLGSHSYDAHLCASDSYTFMFYLWMKTTCHTYKFYMHYSYNEIGISRLGEKVWKKPVSVAASLKINISLHVRLKCCLVFFTFIRRRYSIIPGKGNKSCHCHFWQGHGGRSKYSIVAIKTYVLWKAEISRGQWCHVGGVYEEDG